MESTQKTLFLQGTNKLIVLITVFVIGGIAPFSHIVYNNSEVRGLFGFPKMNSFLFAIGFPVLTVVLSYLLFFASTKMEGQLKKAFVIFSIITSFIGLFFLVWALAPALRTYGNDFPAWIYYTAMILISISLSIGLNLLHRYTNKGVIKLKRMVYHLVDFIAVEIPKKFIKGDDINEYNEDKWNALGKGSGVE